MFKKSNVDTKVIVVEVSKLKIGPGEILLVRFPKHPDPERNRYTADLLRNEFAQLSLACIVTSDDLEFSVIKDESQVAHPELKSPAIVERPELANKMYDQ
jgi:hypothetical protein